MSNVQIPNLPVAIALNGTEALEAVQSGTSVQTTVAGIAQYSYAYYPGFYISQLPAASSVNSTDIFPVVQGSIGPNTGTTYKATVAQLFTSPTFTGTTTLGGGAANYITVTGAVSGSSPVIASNGSDANPDITFTPKGAGRTTINGDLQIVGPFNGIGPIKTTKFTYNDAAVTSELNLINTVGGGNSITVRNLATSGYSAYVSRDDNGIERMAIGVGNSTSAQPDVVYWEASYFTGSPHTTPPPTIKIQQTGFMFGAYNQYNRMLFTNTGRIQFIKSNNINAGFVFDSVTSSLVINPTGATATAGSIFDAIGTSVFGSGSRSNATVGSPAVAIGQADGNFFRMIRDNIGTAQIQMSGNTTTRALDFVNTDNSSLVMMSMKLNGSGRVDIRLPASTTLAASTTYANDAAAAAGGVAIGDFYRNGSVVQCRIT